MEALLTSLATRYGYEYAKKLLGIDQQQQNPKYALSMGGTNFDVGNTAKKSMFNQGIRALTGSSNIGMAVPLMAGALGLAYLRNPLRKGSMNYMPGLQQELNFAANKDYLDGYKYAGDSVLSGQNAVSAFGTNSYIGQLENKVDYFTDRIAKGKKISEENYAETLNELAEAKGFTEVNNETKTFGPYKPQDSDTTNENDGDNDGNQNSGAATNSQGMTSAQHGAFRMARGGIASL
jgi:hypothetical protein